MDEQQQQKIANISSTQIRHLLYVFELLNQALEVKMESIFSLPQFLHLAVNRIKSRSAVEELTGMGEQIMNHVRSLSRIITDLGGTVDQGMLPHTKMDSREPLANLTFQEELASQILAECQTFIAQDWQDSDLKRWVQAQLRVVVEQSVYHKQLLDSLFADTQPRYRDVIMERFRVTALP